MANLSLKTNTLPKFDEKTTKYKLNTQKKQCVTDGYKSNILHKLPKNNYNNDYFNWSNLEKSYIL